MLQVRKEKELEKEKMNFVSDLFTLAKFTKSRKLIVLVITLFVFICIDSNSQTVTQGNQWKVPESANK